MTIQKIKIGIIIILFFNNHNFAQNKNCEKIYENVISILSSKSDTINYNKAIKKMTAYKLCCDKSNINKADSLLAKIYLQIDQERIKAIKNEKVAKKEKNNALCNYYLSLAQQIDYKFNNHNLNTGYFEQWALPLVGILAAKSIEYHPNETSRKLLIEKLSQTAILEDEINFTDSIITFNYNNNELTIITYDQNNKIYMAETSSYLGKRSLILNKYLSSVSFRNIYSSNHNDIYINCFDSKQNEYLTELSVDVYSNLAKIDTLLALKDEIIDNVKIYENKMYTTTINVINDSLAIYVCVKEPHHRMQKSKLISKIFLDSNYYKHYIFRSKGLSGEEVGDFLIILYELENNINIVVYEITKEDMKFHNSLSFEIGYGSKFEINLEGKLLSIIAEFNKGNRPIQTITLSKINLQNSKNEIKKYIDVLDFNTNFLYLNPNVVERFYFFNENEDSYFSNVTKCFKLISNIQNASFFYFIYNSGFNEIGLKYLLHEGEVKGIKCFGNYCATYSNTNKIKIWNLKPENLEDKSDYELMILAKNTFLPFIPAEKLKEFNLDN